MKTKISLSLFLACIIPFLLMSQNSDSLIEGPTIYINPNSSLPISVNSPTGYRVVTGGWKEEAGNDVDLSVRRSYPTNSNLNQWRFDFVNHGTATDTVRTFIICRRESLDSLIEGTTVYIGPNSSLPISVNSPTGYRVVTGGWKEEAGNDVDLSVRRSYPTNSNLNQWRFDFVNHGTATDTVRTFIICRRESLDSLIEGTTVYIGPNSSLPISVNSPTGYRVVTGGWKEEAGNDVDLSVRRSYPTNSNLNQWRFDFVNSGTATDTVRTFIICARNLTTDVEDILTEIPKEYSLLQNYPNPFNPTTTISFNLPSKSFISLKIFDLIGREQATIVSEEMSQGNYSRQWNAERFPSGIYFYRLQTGIFSETKKLLLLR